MTFGDAGPINYVLLVNPNRNLINEHRWQGEMPEFGTPKHPVRKIFDAPPAYEFATPVPGTYPPWYDPSYWLDGLILRFSLDRQIRASATNIQFYYDVFLGKLIFGYLVLLFAAGVLKPSLKELIASWRLLVPAAAGLGIYCIGTTLFSLPWQPPTRYVTPFIVLAFAGAFSSLRLADSQASRRLVVGMTIATLFAVGSQLAFNAVQEVARAGTAEFVNGVRLVYPMEQDAMKFFNMIANKFFGLAFTWLLGQPIKDTLCGTKVLFRADYEAIARNRSYFGDFDPFGDFDLLFGAAKLNLRIMDLPIRYAAALTETPTSSAGSTAGCCCAW